MGLLSDNDISRSDFIYKSNQISRKDAKTLSQKPIKWYFLCGFAPLRENISYS
jgi:hypothetical protein